MHTISRDRVRQLSRSRIYKEYEEAFRGATGLPLALTSVEKIGLALQGDVNEGVFCQVMAKSSRSCAACLEVQERLKEQGQDSPVSIRCFAGLYDTVVPVRIGQQVLGFLRTGQVRTDAPTETEFRRVTHQLIEWGLNVNLSELREAFFASKVLTSDQYSAMLRLLRVFAEHLGSVSNQVLVSETHAENPMITRAKDFIAKNQAEEISLKDVARAINTSTFYFCKMFKKATGLTFTEYLGRTRVERAKNLLLNPNLRVSEIAFEVGFQSLSQFNRVFKTVAGSAPTEYREKLPRRSS